jgi:4-amino-4-deoxy-L-arabinose transferase-like glycosyltransferase
VTSDLSPPARLRAGPAVLLVAIAWALAAAPWTDSVPVHRASVARAWVVARNMADTGDLLVPEYRDEPRLKKPPLASWVQAGTMRAAGTRSVEAAAWGSWALGFLWSLAPFLVGAAASRPVAGLLGSLALASSRAGAWWGWSPEHDVPFGAIVGLAWASLARALSPSGRAVHSWLAGLATGAALLVKGPFALAFVGGTAVVEAWRLRRDPGAGRVRWIPLVLGTLAPPAAWLALVAGRLGGVAPVFDEIRRQALGEAGAHVKPGLLGLLSYAAVIPAWSLPWVVAGVAAAFAWPAAGTRGSRPSLAFAWTALIVGFVTLTAVPSKQDHYAVPLLPAVFLLLGGALEGVLAAGPPRRRAAWGWIVLVTGASLAAWRVAGARALGFVPPPAWTAAGLVAAGAFLLRRRGTEAGAIAGIPRAAAAALLAAAALAGWAAHADRERGLAAEDYREAVRALPADALGRGPVVGLSTGPGEAFDALGAWLDVPIRRERYATSVVNWIDAREPFTLLVPESERAGLAPLEGEFLETALLSPRLAKSPKDRVHVWRHQPR